MEKCRKKDLEKIRIRDALIKFNSGVGMKP